MSAFDRLLGYASPRATAAVLGRELAPTPHDLAQTIAALRAENRSLRTQLHRQEDRLAMYRHLDEALDGERLLAPLDPQETTA